MKKLLYGFLISLFLIQNVYSAVPITFTNGTTADATEVNQNFNYFEGKFSTTSGHDHDGSDSQTITKLGTVTTGTWQASIISGTYGGTGIDSYATGDLVYATASSALVRRALGTLGSILIADVGLTEPNWLAPGTSGKPLVSNGTATNPSYQNLPISALNNGTSASATTYWRGDGTWAAPSVGMQYTDSRFYVGSFTRDTTSASGTQAVTGTGFSPKAVIFFAVQDTSREISWGMDDGTNSLVVTDRSAAAGTYGSSGLFSIFDDEAASTSYTGEVTSFDSDGFTINWVKTGTPSGTLTVYYLAYR